jgi:hypothetical protein
MYSTYSIFPHAENPLPSPPRKGEGAKRILDWDNALSDKSGYYLVTRTALSTTAEWPGNQRFCTSCKPEPEPP